MSSTNYHLPAVSQGSIYIDLLAAPSAYCLIRRDTSGFSNWISCQADSEADYYPAIIYSDLLKCKSCLAIPV
jgi:hypothetical protein